jgi:hypothetical protein
MRDAVLQATRFRDFTLDAPWLKLLERIARTRELPAVQIAPLFDYLEVRRQEGASLDVPTAVLLRGMQRWHAELRDAAARRTALQYGPQFDERWAASLPATSFEGNSEHGDYAVSELRSFRELFEEGQAMHHCVFTYAHIARAGTVSIWSLRVTQAGREVGRVTVRVVVKERAVVEARRRCNHSIEPHERELPRGWAASRGLSLASGV